MGFRGILDPVLATHCPSCGAAVRISLATPGSIYCTYCRYQGRPAPEAERHMLEALQVLRASDVRNRQVAGLRRFLVGSGKTVSGCMLVLAAVLTVAVGMPTLGVLALILPGVLSGWREKTSWVIGISPLPLGVLVGGVAAALLVRRAVRRLELACAAVPPERPGEPASCHACGAPLVQIGEQAIVRCEYCQTDNVATRRALELAHRRRDVVLGDYARRIRDVSLRVPVFTLFGGLGWFLLVGLTVVGSCAGAQIYEAKVIRETSPQGADSLVAGQSVVSLGLGPSDVFFQTGARLGAVPKAGGAMRTLAEFQPTSATNYSLVLDEAHAYWVTTRGEVMQVALSGGAPSRLGRIEDANLGNLRLAADADALYCSTPRRIAKFPKRGAAAVTLADVTFVPNSIAVDARAVYWLENGASRRALHRLRRVAKDGGEVLELQQADSIDTRVTPVSDGEHLYYVANYGNSINRIPVAGGAWTRIGENTESDIEHLALDGPDLYFVTRYDSLGCSGSTYGKLRRMPKTGGPVVTLSAGFKTPSGLVLDASHAYVGDLYRSTVVRIPKSRVEPNAR